MCLVWYLKDGEALSESKGGKTVADPSTSKLVKKGVLWKWQQCDIVLTCLGNSYKANLDCLWGSQFQFILLGSFPKFSQKESQ